MSNNLQYFKKQLQVSTPLTQETYDKLSAQGQNKLIVGEKVLVCGLRNQNNMTMVTFSESQIDTILDEYEILDSKSDLPWFNKKGSL